MCGWHLVVVSDVGEVDVLCHPEGQTKTVSLPRHRQRGLPRSFESVQVLEGYIRR